MLAKKREEIAKISLAAIIFSAALAAPALAQSVTSGLTTSQVRFSEIYLLGKGIAVNPSNNLDISIVTLGLAKVTVNVAGTDTDVVAGVLHFGDNQTYKVKNADIGNGTISGDIYDNATNVGSFSLTLVAKPSDNIWAGSMTLNGQTYNLYILEAHTQYTASEEAQTLADYCASHQDDSNCRNKVENFCQTNPEDARCQALLHNYCKSNLQDGRCREDLSGFCEKNPSDSSCAEFCKRYPKVCGPEFNTTSTSTSSATSQTETTLTTTAPVTNATTSSTTTTVTSVANQTQTTSATSTTTVTNSTTATTATTTQATNSTAGG